MTFSFSRLVNAIVNPNNIEAQRAADTELQMVSTGQNFGGITIPPEAVASLQQERVGTRFLSTSAGSGAGVVMQDHRGEDFIDALMGRNFALERATVHTGLVGEVEIPAESNVVNGSWVGETTAPNEVDPTIRQISLKPKRLGVFTEVSRALLAMGNPDVEDLVQRLLTRAIANALDTAILYGSGQDNQPKGIANLGTDGVPNISLSAGDIKRGDKVWEACRLAERRISSNNVDESNVEALMSPSFYYTCRFNSWDGNGNDTTIDSKLAILPTPDAPLMEQYPQTKSGKANTGKGMFFGDFSQVVVGQWTEGFEILINPYIKDTQGLVRINVETLADVQFRHKAIIQVKQS